jgi:hypothetical protein
MEPSDHNESPGKAFEGFFSMARTRKDQWRERYFKENWCQSVYLPLLHALETEAANLQRLTAQVKDESLRPKLQEVADRFSLLTAQAAGRNSDFDLSALSLPEDVAAKIPDPRRKAD